MLEVCRQRLDAAGLAGRCSFHLGFIHELPASAPFAAATSLLVSQFLTHPPDRIAFFQAIARHLGPGSRYINADLSADLEAEPVRPLKDAWRQMLIHADLPPEKASLYLEGWRCEVAVLPPHQIEAMLLAAGFAEPALFYQSLFIHAWSSRIPG